jgi:hypothetical protein
MILGLSIVGSLLMLSNSLEKTNYQIYKHYICRQQKMTLNTQKVI